GLRAVEFDRAHLARKGAGQADQSGATAWREVLERDGFAGEHALADIHRHAHQATGAASLILAGDVGLDGDVHRLPQELAGVGVDGLAVSDLADRRLHSVADDLVRNGHGPESSRNCPSDVTARRYRGTVRTGRSLRVRSCSARCSYAGVETAAR